MFHLVVKHRDAMRNAVMRSRIALAHRLTVTAALFVKRYARHRRAVYGRKNAVVNKMPDHAG
jgi:hypothetical protein